jgi:hypothetical protein
MSRATPAPRPRLLLWSLAALATVLSAGAVVLAVSLLRGRTTEAPTPRRIAVPFEGHAELWEPFRRWVVQEDGRNKPFDT